MHKLFVQIIEQIIIQIYTNLYKLLASIYCRKYCRKLFLNNKYYFKILRTLFIQIIVQVIRVLQFHEKILFRRTCNNCEGASDKLLSTILSSIIYFISRLATCFLSTIFSRLEYFHLLLDLRDRVFPTRNRKPSDLIAREERELPLTKFLLKFAAR